MEEQTTATAGTQEPEAQANGAQDQQGQNEAAKTYTQEEFDKTLQSEADKRVQQALKTAQSKWQQEYEAKLDAEKSEAAKLAKMSAEDRAKAEAEKERKAFEREREQYQRERLEFETTKQLAEKKLPVQFAAMLAGKDAEATKANLESFEKAWSDAIQAATDEKLKGSPPKTGGKAETDPFLTGFGR